MSTLWLVSGPYIPSQECKNLQRNISQLVQWWMKGEEWLSLDDPENLWHISGWLWLLQRSWSSGSRSSWTVIAFWWETATATVCSRWLTLGTPGHSKAPVVLGVSLCPLLYTRLKRMAPPLSWTSTSHPWMLPSSFLSTWTSPSSSDPSFNVFHQAGDGVEREAMVPPGAQLQRPDWSSLI